VKKWARYLMHSTQGMEPLSIFMTTGEPDQVMIADRKMAYIWGRKEECAPNAVADLTVGGIHLFREDRCLI
jgi:hypothetical protein